MQEEVTNPVDVIRLAKRSVLKDVRNKHKDIILCNKRLGLNEVSEYVHNVSIVEFKELLLKLKQKNVPLELLKKIKNSCVSHEYIEAVVRCEGAFNSLVRILIGNDAFKQLEAAACLTNLACGSHKCSYKVAKTSGVYLISFVSGNSYFLQEQSVWALGNVANDCLDCFNIIKSQGVLPVLLKSLTSPLANVVQSAIFALNACTKYEDPEIISLIQTGLPNNLLTILGQENVDKYIFLNAAFTLSNCCFLSAKYSLNIFNTENVENIISISLKIMRSPEADKMMVSPLLQCIGFLSFSDKICQFISSHVDFYEIIHIIVSSKSYISLFKLTLWTLSNVAASADQCDVTNMEALLDFAKNILKQEKSLALLLLYYLSILQSKNKCISHQLMHHEICVEIKALLECEDKDILQASRTLLELMQQEQ